MTTQSSTSATTTERTYQTREDVPADAVEVVERTAPARRWQQDGPTKTVYVATLPATRVHVEGTLTSTRGAYVITTTDGATIELQTGVDADLGDTVRGSYVTDDGDRTRTWDVIRPGAGYAQREVVVEAVR